MFSAYIGGSILGRALARKKFSVTFYNPRDFTSDKHKTVDERPYGGGPGMVMSAEPLLKAAICALSKANARREKGGAPRVIIFSPSGKQFTNTLARKFAKENRDIILIAGRYEGIDARVKKILKAEEFSIGPYVLTGGEVPAMAVIDATVRQIPGVLGTHTSIEEERVASSEVYTRPEKLLWKGVSYRVPKVLLTGDHKKIGVWRMNRARTIRKKR